MTFDRSAAAELALSYAGLVANPADADAYQRFRDLVAPEETNERAAEILRSSTCALVASGYLRALLARCPLPLAPPYRTGTAPSNVEHAAELAKAVRPASYVPQQADIVHLAAGGGGVEHLYLVTSAEATPGATEIESVDGGQVELDEEGKPKPGGHQAILARKRTILPSGSGAVDDEEPLVAGGFAARRPVWRVYDVEALVACFGWRL